MASKAIALLPHDFHKTALAFPDKVRAALAKNPPVVDSVKALRGGDGLLHLAKDLRATKQDINAIQRGRFHLIAHIGELLPAEQGKGGGRGNKKPPKAGLGSLSLSAPTLATYRKVAKHKADIDGYFAGPAEQEDEAVSVSSFIRNVTGTEKAGRSAHVSANTGIPEWYTPSRYIEAAREVLGGIDLDPASSKIAQRTVKAATFYTVDDDGLSKAWSGRVWMNPPYSADLVAKFSTKLCEHIARGDISQAIVIVNNATETTWFQQMASQSAALCFPSQRVRFLDEEGKPGAPLQGQALLYFGKRAKTFVSKFRTFGFCVVAVR